MRCCAQVRAPAVGDGDERTGTGFFDAITWDLLQDVLMCTPLSDRLTCAIRVCRSWRALQGCTALWTEVDCAAWSYDKSRVVVNGIGFNRLLNWLPDLSAVTRLRLETGNKGRVVPPDVIKSALPRLPGLTELDLSGKKVTGAVLTLAAKQPFAPKLTEISLGSDCVSGDDALKLLGAASKLTRLQMGWGFSGLGQDLLGRLAAAWRKGRGGEAVPLLSHLTLKPEYSGVSWESLASLGTNFPELVEVVVKETRILEVRGAASVLPRLKTLHLNKLSTFSQHMTTAALEDFLNAMLPACPVLEDLSLKHGTMWISGRERAEGKKQEPFPSANAGALNHLPPSLKRLVLADIHLEADAFSAVGLEEPKSIQLRNCGPHTEAIAADLRVSFPGADVQTDAPRAVAGSSSDAAGSSSGATVYKQTTL